MGHDGDNAEGGEIVSPSSGPENSRYVSLASPGGGMGVVIGGGGLGGDGDI